MPRDLLAESASRAPRDLLSETRQPQPPGMARGVAQSAMQGATLGFADELQGLIAGIVSDDSAVQRLRRALGQQDVIPTSQPSFGERATQATRELRAEDEAFSAQNPGTALAANVAGGLATGGGLVKGAQALGLPLTGLKGAATTGTGIGAVAGAGAAPEGEALEGAAKGAALGFGAGLTISGVGALAGAAKRRLAPGVENRIRNLAKVSGLTPAQIQTRLDALGPKATIADVDDVFMRAGDVAAGRLGPAARRVKELIRRDETQFSRIMEPIRRTFGGSAAAAKTASELKDLRFQQASPIYERAFAKGVVNTNRLKDLLSRPEVQRAWRQVQSIGKSDPDIDVSLLAKGADPSFRGWQSITERLWDRASVLERSGQAKFANVIKRLRRNILSELDEQSGEFAFARKLWSGTKQADDAMELGSKFFRMSPNEIKEELAQMSISDKEFFRLGVGRAIEEKLATKADTSDLSRLFRNEAFREKAFTVFDDKRSAVDFLNTIRAEAIKKNTTNLVGRGSQTQPRQAVERQLGGTPIGTQDFNKAGVLNRILSSISGPRETTLQEIGNLLLAQDPATQRRAIQMMSGETLPPLLRLGPTGAAGANITGQRSGR